MVDQVDVSVQAQDAYNNIYLGDRDHILPNTVSFYHARLLKVA